MLHVYYTTPDIDLSTFFVKFGKILRKKFKGDSVTLKNVKFCEI